jgi:hypothetical protein
LLPSRGFFFRGLPTLALYRELPAHRQGIHRKNFIRGLPTLTFHEINSGSAGNYQLIDIKSNVRMGFPPGITSSGTRNPLKEYDSAGNNQLMEANSDRQDQNMQIILTADQQVQILYTAKVNFFLQI